MKLRWLQTPRCTPGLLWGCNKAGYELRLQQYNYKLKTWEYIPVESKVNLP